MKYIINGKEVITKPNKKWMKCLASLKQEAEKSERELQKWYKEWKPEYPKYEAKSLDNHPANIIPIKEKRKYPNTWGQFNSYRKGWTQQYHQKRDLDYESEVRIYKLNVR